MPLTIGQEGLAGDPRPFFGLIHEMRVWNRALNQEEIQSQMSMRLTGNEPGLVAYYNFDDQTANDSSSQQNYGELVGTAELVEDPFVLLEIHRAVEILTFSGSSEMTYQLQFKTDAGATEWADFGEPFKGGEPVQFFDSTRETGRKIYRVIRVQ